MTEDPAAILRARLDERGVRQIIDSDDYLTPEALVNRYGLCPEHRTPMYSQFRYWLDDNDHLHAETSLACTTDGHESG